MENKKLTQVVALQSEDGDWYVLPKELENQFQSDEAELSEYHSSLRNFDEAGQDEQWDIISGLEQDFENKYGEYATGGDLNLIDLYTYFEDEK